MIASCGGGDGGGDGGGGTPPAGPTPINELYVANGSGNTITAHGRTANGNVAALRTIGGATTGFVYMWNIVADAVNNEIIVADYNGNSVKVFNRSANGNVAPIRTIAGADYWFKFARRYCCRHRE